MISRMSPELYWMTCTTLLNAVLWVPYIAQLVVQRVEAVQWQLVDTLDGDDRGGGFGHSGRA